MTGGLISTGYIVFVGAAYFLLRRHYGIDSDNFAKIFPSIVAALTSLLAAVIAYVNVKRQAELSLKVERYKADLSKEVEDSKLELSTKLEQAKFVLSGDIEALKVRLTEESNAYSELLKAMDIFYYAMAKLEEGTYKAKEAKTLDDSLGSFSYYLYRLNEACRPPFEQYWERLHFIRERCEDLATVEEKRELWQSTVREIADYHADFVAAFNEHHRAGPGS
ncbi:hypothetical protein AWB78_04019 [Caballeronia calidae]|uniref:Uncharacterized protein n=2 Tax=Caballeronia calidae TaxID=1777139 RepID=A0A158CKK0_9BURK|nr:hypothetical protein AWB78_04019 [Caballeronia calidae]